MKAPEISGTLAHETDQVAGGRGFAFERDTFVFVVNGKRQGRREALDLRYINAGS